MEIEKLIDAFVSATDIGPVSPVEGVWKFSADGHVFGVMTDEFGEKVFLFGDLPSPAPDREEAFRKALLEANFFGRGTGGAVFSINPETGAYTLVLSERLDRLDPKSFFALVEGFVNTLAAWNGIASAAQPVAPAEAETVLPSSESLGFSDYSLTSSFMRI